MAIVKATPTELLITHILIDQLGVDEGEVTRTAALGTDLGMDSLDTIEVVMEIEEEFGIEIPDDAYNKGQFRTVGDIVTYVEGKAGKR